MTRQITHPERVEVHWPADVPQRGSRAPGDPRCRGAIAVQKSGLGQRDGRELIHHGK
jgi:hypothetical protein